MHIIKRNDARILLEEWLPASCGFRAYCEVDDVEYMAGTWGHKTH